MTLTKGDFKKLEEKFATKEELRQFKEDVVSEVSEQVDKIFEKYRDEFATKIDPILKEVQTEPQERAILSNRLEHHEGRITILEKASD
ncbi:MAG TPA: hypothetical protein VF185_03870 [Patescibacteria group bacterium]